MLDDSTAVAEHGVSLRKWNCSDCLHRSGRALSAAAHVGGLAGGIGADYGEIGGGAQVFMTDAGGQEDHIAGLYLLNRAFGPAQADLRHAAVAAEDFMGVAVIVGEGIDAVAPAVRPVVGFEDRFEHGCAVAVFIADDALVKDHWEGGIVGYVAVIFEVEEQRFDVVQESAQVARHRPTVFQWLKGGERSVILATRLMGHQDSYYKNNDAYAEFLSGWDPAFYGKYVDTLKPDVSGGRALDVGCGVGQVVHQLDEAGIEAHGVDVSGPNIEKAKQHSERCQLYDGKRLPFEDGQFDSVGALNVLEHVDEPEAFIADLVRVVKPGGRITISSPNFSAPWAFVTTITGCGAWATSGGTSAAC